MYNQAFDPYNGIYRMLYIMKYLDMKDDIEVDRLRIFDFYLLFPYKIYKIHLKKTEGKFKELRKRVNHKRNPYNVSPNDRRFFERLRPYQMIALSHIASYGIISTSLLLQQKVKIIDADKLQTVMSKLEKLPVSEQNVLAWLTYCFRCTPLKGEYGLKYRTELMEYKYDGC